MTSRVLFFCWIATKKIKLSYFSWSTRRIRQLFTHSNTHTRSLQSHTLTLTNTHTPFLQIHSLHTHTNTHTTNTLTPSLSLSLSLTLTHTHYLYIYISISHTQTHTLSSKLTLSWSWPLTRRGAKSSFGLNHLSPVPTKKEEPRKWSVWTESKNFNGTVCCSCCSQCT